MTFRGRLAPALNRSGIASAAYRTLAIVLVAAALAGCGSDGMSALLVDPARFDGYGCKDLVSQWQALLTREKQLRNLINRADDSAGGVVIGALTYRSEYQTVLEQEKVLQRAAAAQKCQLVSAATPSPTSTFSSDQVIR